MTTMTAREFTARLAGLGLTDARLEDHGCGSQMPVATMPNRCGLIVSAFEGFVPDPDLPMDAGPDWPDWAPSGGLTLDDYTQMSAVLYESADMNAAQWPDRQGLDFNTPIAVSDSGTPEAVLAIVADWITALRPMSLGVPYAVVNVDTGARTCPVCTQVFAEDYDADDKPATTNYPDHYMAAHAADAVRAAIRAPEPPAIAGVADDRELTDAELDAALDDMVGTEICTCGGKIRFGRCRDCELIWDHTQCPDGSHDFTYDTESFASGPQNHDGSLLLCNDCRAPMFYCNADNNWHHGGEGVAPCFLIPEDITGVPVPGGLRATPAAIAGPFTADDLIMIHEAVDAIEEYDIVAHRVAPLLAKVVAALAGSPDAVDLLARRIVTEVRDDMHTGFAHGKTIPPWVSTFGQLHDHCDANDYLQDLPFNGGGTVEEEDAGLAFLNAVSTRVGDMLLAEGVHVRARMVRMVDFALANGWEITDPAAAAELRQILDAFADPATTALTLTGRELARYDIDAYAAQWYDDAAHWAWEQSQVGWYEDPTRFGGNGIPVTLTADDGDVAHIVATTDGEWYTPRCMDPGVGWDGDHTRPVEVTDSHCPACFPPDAVQPVQCQTHGAHCPILR